MRYGNIKCAEVAMCRIGWRAAEHGGKAVGGVAAVNYAVYACGQRCAILRAGRAGRYKRAGIVDGCTVGAVSLVENLHAAGQRIGCPVAKEATVGVVC